MARTRAAATTVRRDAFLDAALRLIEAKGYERMSVEDVIREVGGSKGAFYHYFDSKRALLEAAMERLTEAGMATVRPVLDDPRLTAPEKLSGVFEGIVAASRERRELVLEAAQAWASDDNAIVREKLRRDLAHRLLPILAAIVEQGVAEGSLAAGQPGDVAAVLVSLVLGLRDDVGELFFAHRSGTVTFEAVAARVAAHGAAMERVLGMPAGTLRGFDVEALRVWF